MLAEPSDFLSHEPCPECGSEDNLARYTDGHGYCFGCGYYQHAEGEQMATSSESSSSSFLTGSFKALVKRKLTEETCKSWGYSVAEIDGTTVQVANYFDENKQRIAQKLRFPDKTFKLIGPGKKERSLYGQWRPVASFKQVVITEGELDALSVSQLQNNKWPVVSLPDGSGSAKKSIQKALDWLNQFEKVILMFDNDEAGQKAVEDCVSLFSPGKAFIAHLPLKDASDMLQAGRGQEVINAIWSAKEYRPDGIVSAEELEESFFSEDQMGVPYPWAELNVMTLGMRPGEIVTFCAGSGIGKSTACREIAHHLLKEGHKVGYIALEESVKKTLRYLVGIEMNKPIVQGFEGISKEELKHAFNTVAGNGRLYLYDHFGSLNSDRLLSRIRYLAKGLDVQWVVLDHISIVVSGDTDISDERRSLDVAMTKLRSLVEETGIGLILVSHLKRPEGKGHEEGAKVSLAQLRGSAAIAQLSDTVLGLERNQQDPTDNNKTSIRILKNRFAGETGLACDLFYSKDTGRLTASLAEF